MKNKGSTEYPTQFYANKAEYKQGASKFEKELVRLDIRHIRARVKHPQTSGKLERLHGELRRKIHTFYEVAPPRHPVPDDAHVGNPFHTEKRKDPVTQFVEWYNNRPHMSLNFDEHETPSQAFIRKMSPEGAVVDEQSGKVYDVKWGVTFGFPHESVDCKKKKYGYDIESRVTREGKLRFIEVKDQATGANTLTVIWNEIRYSLNKPEDFILAIVEFLADGQYHTRYHREPFNSEPDFTNVNYDFAKLLARSEEPS